MSDDIAIIFAQQKMAPPPVAVFLSATHPNQMEQYVLAGWRVMIDAAFSGCDIPSDLMCEPFDPDLLDRAPALLSGQITDLPDDWVQRVQLLTPSMVKINAAFSDNADEISTAAAALSSQNYTLCAAHWRDDNAVGIKVLDRIDALSVFQPTPWSSLNVMAFADAAQARDMLRFGRFYAGQEKRIGELTVTNTIRGDYISQLEEAMMSKQLALQAAQESSES